MSTIPLLVPGVPSTTPGGRAGRPDTAYHLRNVQVAPRTTGVRWPLRTVATPLGVVALGITDLLAAALALAIAGRVAVWWPGALLTPSAMPTAGSATLFLVVGTALAVVARVHLLYGAAGQRSAIEETYIIAKTVAVTTGIGAASTLFYRDSQLSALVLAGFWAVASISIATVHGISRGIVTRLYGRDPRPAVRLSLVEPGTRPLILPADRAFVIGSRLGVLSVGESQHRDWPYECWSQIKRDLDVLLAAALLLISAPLMLTLAAAIRATSPGPAFFRQDRIGRYGNPFGIFKFRTMRSDAEAVLAADPTLYAAYVANDYKLAQDRDPRVTPLGRWLRRTSLDELPQLLNVLRGEMSLVGPRPIVAAEIAHYGDRAHIFQAAMPGLTGAWQVAGRSDVRYPERCDVELEYVRNWSLPRDIRILLATVRQVVAGRGAV
jgi:lipopolysaccharide/colanic/teichoic acid biosynthesis glycosyltransferase